MTFLDDDAEIFDLADFDQPVPVNSALRILTDPSLPLIRLWVSSGRIDLQSCRFSALGRRGGTDIAPERIGYDAEWLVSSSHLENCCSAYREPFQIEGQ